MQTIMMFPLKKKLSLTHFPSFIPKTSASFYLLNFSSSSDSATQDPPPKSSLITEYLITSCGLSPQRAATASRPIASVTSLHNLDLVRHFFKHLGFTDAHLCKMISNNSRILCADVDRTLQPNFRALREMGFEDHELRKLITTNTNVLIHPCAVLRLEFWKTFMNDDKKFLLAFLRNRGLINQDIDRIVMPKIALLKKYGLSEGDIRKVVAGGHGIISRSNASMEAVLKRAQELGFTRGSSMFLYGLWTLSSIGLDMYVAKMDFFRTFGWSEEEFLAAFQKAPFIINLSKENIKEKMGFLVGRAACTQAYIASHPLLLGFSLEKRLMPRYHMLSTLKSSGWVGREMNLYSIMCFPERAFVERIILRNKEQAPKLHDTYIAACAGQIPL